MTAAAKYAVTGAGVVALTSLALMPVLDADGRRGVLVAAAVALPVQLLAFWALLRFRDRVNGFLAAWVGGMVLRWMVLAVVAAIAIQADLPGAIPMLLSLAGFFFGLTLLESRFFKLDLNETINAQAKA